MTKTAAQTASSQPQRIAVIGLGGIGSAFAFQLARVGRHEVTAIARPGSARLEQLQRAGGVVDTKGELAKVRVADSLNEATSYDLVLVTLPAYQIPPVLPALQRCTASHIQFMFNIYEPEQLQNAIGAHRCSFGMPFIQASITEAGELQARIGAGGQKTKMSNPNAVSLFNRAGLPATLESEMLLWLRCHVPLCVAFESVSVAAMRRGGGASWTDALTIARGLQESLSLIKQLGYRLYPRGKVWLHSSPVLVPASLLWVMSHIQSFRELLATGRDECDALVAAMVKDANRVMQPMAVACIEAMKPKGFKKS